MNYSLKLSHPNTLLEKSCIPLWKQLTKIKILFKVQNTKGKNHFKNIFP